MRKMKAYVPKDDFEFPKAIDKKRFTAVLIRQSDHKAEADHIFSRESQLKLVPYAVRLRGDETAEWVRIYDEGAGVSGQKRIDQRKELNRLYADIKAGIIGSLVIIHEDRLFRDDRGRIAPGLRADLLLVEGDPGSDILATRHIRGVWKRGSQ